MYRGFDYLGQWHIWKMCYFCVNLLSSNRFSQLFALINRTASDHIKPLFSSFSAHLLPDGLKHVQEIKFNKCIYIEDACLEKLSSVESLQQSLVTMEVVSCGNVTDKGVVALHRLRSVCFSSWFCDPDSRSQSMSVYSMQESGAPVPQWPPGDHWPADDGHTAADSAAAAELVAGPGLTGFQMKAHWMTITACLILHRNVYLRSLFNKSVKTTVMFVAFHQSLVWILIIISEENVFYCEHNYFWLIVSKINDVKNQKQLNVVNKRWEMEILKAIMPQMTKVLGE